LPNPQGISKKENVKRHIWFFVQKYLMQPSPKCLSRWRVFWLRLFGAQIGPHCYIAASAYIHLPWKLQIGASSTIDERCYLQGEISIGAHVAIGNNVHIVTEGHNVRSRYFEGQNRPVRIENSVFVGGDAYIARGVTVGQFSVVGAKSVVWHDVPENTIAYGNPCVVHAQRIPPEEYLHYSY
jgi:putative colanic acid biosynthesis acetyltransferase WcaF